jgi:hypothetical protein
MGRPLELVPGGLMLQNETVEYLGRLHLRLKAGSVSMIDGKFEIEIGQTLDELVRSFGSGALEGDFEASCSSFDGEIRYFVPEIVHQPAVGSVELYVVRRE